MQKIRPTSEMSLSSMRAELLEILSVLFPEREWRSRVPAKDVADFTIASLADHTGVAHGQRALGLAWAIKKERD